MYLFLLNTTLFYFCFSRLSSVKRVTMVPSCSYLLWTYQKQFSLECLVFSLPFAVHMSHFGALLMILWSWLLCFFSRGAKLLLCAGGDFLLLGFPLTVWSHGLSHGMNKVVFPTILNDETAFLISSLYKYHTFLISALYLLWSDADLLWSRANMLVSILSLQDDKMDECFSDSSCVKRRFYLQISITSAYHRFNFP